MLCIPFEEDLIIAVSKVGASKAKPGRGNTMTTYSISPFFVQVHIGEAA